MLLKNNASYNRHKNALLYLCNLHIDAPFQNRVFHSGLYRFLNDNFPLSPPFYAIIFPSDTQTKMEFWDTARPSDKFLITVTLWTPYKPQFQIAMYMKMEMENILN